MNERDTDYRIPVFVVIGIVLVLVAISVIYILSDNSDKTTHSGTSATVSPSPAQVTDEPVAESFRAIIASVDTDNCEVVMYRLGNTEPESFIYTGATNVLTAYDRAITLHF